MSLIGFDAKPTKIHVVPKVDFLVAGFFRRCFLYRIMSRNAGEVHNSTTWVGTDDLQQENQARYYWATTYCSQENPLKGILL